MESHQLPNIPTASAWSTAVCVAGAVSLLVLGGFIVVIGILGGADVGSGGAALGVVLIGVVGLTLFGAGVGVTWLVARAGGRARSPLVVILGLFLGILGAMAVLVSWLGPGPQAVWVFQILLPALLFASIVAVTLPHVISSEGRTAMRGRARLVASIGAILLVVGSLV